MKVLFYYNHNYIIINHKCMNYLKNKLDLKFEKPV